VRPGDTLVVTFETDEEVDEPVVDLGGFFFTRDGDDDDPYSYSLDVGATDLLGSYSVGVSLKDAAENSAFSLHGLVTIDARAPGLLAVDVTPELAPLGSTVFLTLTVDEHLDPGTPPVLGFLGADPGFVFAASAGFNHTFALDVGETTPSGVTTLVRASLVDVAGNAAVVETAENGDLPAVITIDTALPEVVGFEQSDTGVNASDTLTVTFTTSEPVREAAPGLEVLVGGVAMARDGTSTTPFSFSLDIEGTGLLGTFAVDVTLTDGAGNENITEWGNVDVDSFPPGLLAAAVAPASARLGVSALLTLTANEALDGPPVLTFSAAGDPGFGSPSTSGFTYSFSLPVTAETPPGDFVLDSVTLTDAAGNTSIVGSGGELPVSFSVDSVAPVITSLSTDRDVTSSISPYDVVTITVVVPEDLAASEGKLSVSVGGGELPACDDGTTTDCCGAYGGAVAGEVGCEKTTTSTTAEGALLITASARDAAGNETVQSKVVIVDHSPPGIALANVGYTPAPSNALGIVTAARNDTLITVTLAASEGLSALDDDAPTLTASNGTDTLVFELDDGNDGGATFSVEPGTVSSGTYTPTLSWTDAVGNHTGTLSFSDPALVVVTDTPVLAVDQSTVSYWRSPWGNGASECLCPVGNASCTPQDDEDVCEAHPGHYVPAGPYFALAPGEPRTADPTLAASAFSLVSTTIVGVRVWADALTSSLVGTAAPDPRGGSG
jgi:hypothetical protein